MIKGMEAVYRQMAVNQWDAMMWSIGEAWRQHGIESERQMIYAEGFAAEAKYYENKRDAEGSR